jgi:tetratricopeptide (TPR) repeat protein
MMGTDGGALAMSSARSFCFFLIVLAYGTGVAQEHEHHSIEKLGTVHFSTSCNGEAQKEFDRAVALLHSFQFSRAIHGFKATLQNDSTCGIAYWGIALSQWSNPFAAGLKDTGQLEAGRTCVDLARSTGAPTPRERAYIDAVANLYRDFENTPQHARLISYRDAMSEVAAKYRNDHEAQIFYALAIAAAEDLSDKTYTGRLKAGEILEELFKEEPDHPGLAHYIIHTYDVPPLASRALDAARRYAEIAPDAPHALHMPSHTFTRTGYWLESINTNIAAVAAAKREGQTAEELHATDYAVYAYLQTAQDDAARKLVNSLPEIEFRFDPKAVIGGAGGPSAGYFALSAIPARYALERGDWKQASQLVARETQFPYTEAMTWFARGLGSARIGQTKTASEAATALKKIHDQLVKAGESYWALQAEIEQRGVEAWITMARGDKQEALHQMESAAELEDETEKSAITPGPLVPARELLGEMLLAADQPDAALQQFEATLTKEPGRFRTLYDAAKSAQLAGRQDLSRNYFKELLKVCEHGDRPGRAEVQEAKRAFAPKPENAPRSTD